MSINTKRTYKNTDNSTHLSRFKSISIGNELKDIMSNVEKVVDKLIDNLDENNKLNKDRSTFYKTYFCNLFNVAKIDTVIMNKLTEILDEDKKPTGYQLESRVRYLHLQITRKQYKDFLAFINSDEYQSVSNIKEQEEKIDYNMLWMSEDSSTYYDNTQIFKNGTCLTDMIGLEGTVDKESPITIVISPVTINNLFDKRKISYEVGNSDEERFLDYLDTFEKANGSKEVKISNSTKNLTDIMDYYKQAKKYDDSDDAIGILYQGITSIVDFDNNFNLTEDSKTDEPAEEKDDNETKTKSLIKSIRDKYPNIKPVELTKYLNKMRGNNE